MRKNTIRNIAIIAHVDHGKTTLVDGMLRQSGIFSAHQELKDRVMDSGDLEKEKGITITAKNTSVYYKGTKINIIDTPGHADFGGEVERGLNLVDGVLLLVDASEGPLPQTRFVLRKAMEKNLATMLVINKIDRPDARISEVINEVYDLFIDLDATEEQIEFPIIYTNAKIGVAHEALGDSSTSLVPLFEQIIKHIPGPECDDNAPTQFLITNLDYDYYVGQVGVGRLVTGSLKMNTDYALCHKEGVRLGCRFSALYGFDGLKRKQMDAVEAGDIVAIAGVEGMTIGDTVCDQANPIPLPRINVDQPTVSMYFYVNNSPFSGRDGKFLTSRHIKDRLMREQLGNVSLKIKDTERADCFEVCGRGELQLAVLIETMRREGYELQVSRPNVITREGENGEKLEPVEELFLDIPEEFVGVMTEKLSVRKGKMTNIQNKGSGRVHLNFVIPTRGLIGFRSQFLTDTKGAGIMNSLFKGYEPWFGVIQPRLRGVMIADRPGRVTPYASLAMEDRGILIVEPNTDVYNGMVIGERNKADDLEVNITREKKLTNHRASGSDPTVTLRPPKMLSLEQAIEMIADDELVEITPKTFRIRKMELDPNKREKSRKTRMIAARDEERDDDDD
ncbi:MAG: translational GTPase TypA [Fibrobacteres bacterium]|nr:translational GTPase TypA [Fibrobacterota bacterium]